MDARRIYGDIWKELSMSGQELFEEMQEKTMLLDKALEMCGKRGRAYSKSHKEYRIALRKAMLEEREKGTPVTILSDICRGRPDIAELCMQRDIAEVVYKASMEAINVYKLEVNLLREQIDREWNRA